MDAAADIPEMTEAEVCGLMAELHEIDTTSLEHLKRPPKVRSHIHALLRAPLDQYAVISEQRQFSGEKAGFESFQAHADEIADAQTAAYRKRWPILVLAQELHKLCKGSDDPLRKAAFARLQDFDPNQKDLSWLGTLADALGVAMPLSVRRGPPSAGRYETTDEFLMPAMHRLMTKRASDASARLKTMTITEAANALAEFAFGPPGECKRLRLEKRYRDYRRTLAASADPAEIVDHEAAELVV